MTLNICTISIGILHWVPQSMSSISPAHTGSSWNWAISTAIFSLKLWSMILIFLPSNVGTQNYPIKQENEKQIFHRSYPLRLRGPLCSLIIHELSGPLFLQVTDCCGQKLQFLTDLHLLQTYLNLTASAATAGLWRNPTVCLSYPWSQIPRHFFAYCSCLLTLHSHYSNNMNQGAGSESKEILEMLFSLELWIFSCRWVRISSASSGVIVLLRARSVEVCCSDALKPCSLACSYKTTPVEL